MFIIIWGSVNQWLHILYSSTYITFGPGLYIYAFIGRVSYPYARSDYNKLMMMNGTSHTIHILFFCQLNPCDSCNVSVHILQGFFTDTEVIAWLRQYHHDGPSANAQEDMGKSSLTLCMHNSWDLQHRILWRKVRLSHVPAINNPFSMLPVAWESVDMVLTDQECNNIKMAVYRRKFAASTV